MDTEYGYSHGYSRNPMATGAVVLGVISLFTCLIFYISIPCGALAVLLAILSRGENKLPGKSKTGIVCGAIGMCLSLGITLASVWTVLTNAQLRAYMERYLQYYLGDSSFDLDRELVTMFPALKDVLGIDESGIDGSTPSDGFDDPFGGLFSSDDRNDTDEHDADEQNDAVDDDGQDDAPAEPSRPLPEGKGDFI